MPGRDRKLSSIFLLIQGKSILKERKIKEICKGQRLDLQILTAGAESEAPQKGLQGNRTELPSASNPPRLMFL